MKPRQPGQTPAATFTAEVAAEVATRIDEARDGGAGLINSGDEWNVAAAATTITPEVNAYRMLGEARAIIAAIISGYAVYGDLNRAHDWVRRFDAEEAAARVRLATPLGQGREL